MEHRAREAGGTDMWQRDAWHRRAWRGALALAILGPAGCAGGCDPRDPPRPKAVERGGAPLSVTWPRRPQARPEAPAAVTGTSPIRGSSSAAASAASDTPASARNTCEKPPPACSVETSVTAPALPRKLAT